MRPQGKQSRAGLREDARLAGESTILHGMVHGTLGRLAHLFAGPVLACWLLSAGGVFAQVIPLQHGIATTHAIAAHGEPALPPDFAHLPHANPDAPKGGLIVIGVAGSFDNLNPLIPRGQTHWPIRQLVYESLLMRNEDEPFSLYGLVAHGIELAHDRRSVTFHMRPAARFSDGTPLTAADVAFSFALLREKGLPTLRSYYAEATPHVLGAHSIRFDIAEGSDNRELPLLLGLMPILPQRHTDASLFGETTLKPLIGSGPYVFGAIAAGASITLEKNNKWWAADLPVMRGLYNFAQIRYDFYRDRGTMFEAFRNGLVDIWFEDDPVRWKREFGFPAVVHSRVKLEECIGGLPRALDAIAFNTRRPALADVRVRKALWLLFDSKWINDHLYASGYEPSYSLFPKSEISAFGRAAGVSERALLAPFPDAVDLPIMDGRWQPHVSRGAGLDREGMKAALALFEAAGYRLRGGRLMTPANEPFRLEVIAVRRDQERLLLAYKRMLDAAGIELVIRLVDSAQFEQRRQTFDFDLIPWRWHGTISPGSEQLSRWGSAAAGLPGAFNLAGVRSKAADAAIDALIAAQTREELVASARVLDRIIMSGAYILPLYHLPGQRIARWSYIGKPERDPLACHTIATWWRGPETGGRR